MTTGADDRVRRLFEDIVQRLGRRYELLSVDAATGRVELRESGRVVQVNLPPPVLGEYADQLDDDSAPGLASEPPERQDGVRARFIVIWIDELIGPDFSRSLRQIVLNRAADGSIFVDRIPEAVYQPIDLPPGDYSWSADRDGREQ